MRIHGLIEQSAVNGPGERAVVWFQGCRLACPGCWNPETHNMDMGEGIIAHTLANRIAAIEGIEGVTFTGGEPMHQASELLDLLFKLNRLRPDLSFGMFSGYTEFELNTGKYEIVLLGHNDASRAQLWRDLRFFLDFAVFGRYNPAKACAEPMRSSRNQQLQIFRPRYSLADFPAQAAEVHYLPDGSEIVTGFPRGQLLE